jgi:ferrous iron transport protein B
MAQALPSPRTRPEALARPKLRLVQPACHDTGSGPLALPDALTIALVGQPNVGKSTVFNMLTGLNQHVGNWPGKTVEQKTGVFHVDGAGINLVDLPGTYSLTANSEEERVARDYLISEHPDAAIAIVNAAALERSLYLVAELLALDTPLVIGLNMSDVAEQHGIHVEAHVLEAALGVRVVPLVAARNEGIRELVAAALAVIRDPAAFEPNRPAIRPEHQPVLDRLVAMLDDCMCDRYGADWSAMKLLEGDAEVTAEVKDSVSPETWTEIHSLLLQHEDAYLDIAGGRYEWIGRMVRAAVTQPRAGAVTITDRIDRVATHPIFGLVLLLGIFGLAFAATYAIATPVSGWLSAVVLGGLTTLAQAVLASSPAWLKGLVIDGFIGGAGTVLTFLPILAIFFALLGVLEDVGYLSRGAYVMDRFMHLMGLHGKSFMPLFLGFGCNVPAVMGARILEERRARFLTILIAPLVPCTARLAVLAFLTPAFFGRGAAAATMGLVALNIVILAVAGVVVNKVAFKGEQTAFIMELPLYHVPNARTVGLYVWNNTTSFLKKAGTFILLSSAVVWALSHLPGGNVETSYLAAAGRALQPVGALMGLNDWRTVVALLSSFFAKENTIATLGVLFGAPAAGATLATQVAAVLVPAARLAFLACAMLFIPCLATVATIKQETRSWRWTAASIGLLLVISVGAAILLYQALSLLG